MGYCVNALFEPEMDGRTIVHRWRYHIGRGFVEPNDVVVDVGSGTGYGSEMLSRIAKKVIGIEMVEAEVKGARQAFPRIEFICDDLEKIEFPECDVAVAFEVLEHLYRPDLLVQKMLEKVRKWIVYSVPLQQVLEWDEGRKEFHERGDHTHKSVFADRNDSLKLFKHPNWKPFAGYQEGINFVSSFYNIKQFK